MKSSKKKSPASPVKRRTASSPKAAVAKPVTNAKKAMNASENAKPAKPPKAAKPAKAPKSSGKKPKTIRDSFNMPADDYALIATLKKRALGAATQAKKSELLRAGLRLLTSLGDEAFKAALAALPAVKMGRPGKSRKA